MVTILSRWEHPKAGLRQASPEDPEHVIRHPERPMRAFGFAVGGSILDGELTPK
jgi:hypothetical protein